MLKDIQLFSLKTIISLAYCHFSQLTLFHLLGHIFYIICLVQWRFFFLLTGSFNKQTNKQNKITPSKGQCKSISFRTYAQKMYLNKS